MSLARTIFIAALVFCGFAAGTFSHHFKNSLNAGVREFLNMASEVIGVGKVCDEVKNASLSPPPRTLIRQKLETECCLEIAHAGGSYLGTPYTNSREALDRNFELGRRIFEIDFIGSCDGEIVLAHDWDHWDEVPSAEQFRIHGTIDGLTAMSLSDLVNWLDKNDAKIVTDTKFSDGPRLLLSHLRSLASEEFINRHFVFQIYSETDGKGLEDYTTILTIYRMGNVSDIELARITRETSVAALTIPDSRAQQSLQFLRGNLPNTPIFVHGPPERINSKEYQNHLENLGASGFYLE